LKALEKIELFSAPSQLHQIGNSLLAAANVLSSKNKVDNTCLVKKLLLELDASGELPVSPLVLSLSLLALLFLLHHVWFSHFLPFAFCFLSFILVSLLSFVELGKIMAEFPHLLLVLC
jgi:hypothetical protein